MSNAQVPLTSSNAAAAKEDLPFDSGAVIALPTIPNTPRQAQAVGFPSPRRELGEKVPDMRSTVVQKRLRLIESKAAANHVNPIAAWPSTGAKSVYALTTRPPLSVEIENYIRKEQRELILTNPDATKAEALPIFKEAFGCIINHFPEYSSILSLIKLSYDQAVDELTVITQRVANIELENKSMKGTHAMQLQQEREHMQTCLNESQAQLAAALRTNQSQRQQISKLEHDVALGQQRLLERQKEFEESQERIRVLSATLVEEGSRMALVLTERQKASREVERLNHLVESLRQLVSESERTIQAFRSAGPAFDGTTRSGSMVGAASPRSFRKAPPKLSAVSTRVDQALTTTKPDDVSAEALASTSASAVIPTQPSKATERRQSRAMAPSPSANNSNNNSAVTGRRASVSTDEAELLREQIFDLECKIEALEHQISQQAVENKKLTWKLSKVMKETDRDTLTPRPDWALAARRLPGYQQDPSLSSDGHVFDLITFMREKLRTETLANERKALGEIVWNWLNDDDILESDLMHRFKSFCPKGTAKTVPIYLRSAVPIRNRRMKKADVETVLNNFWTHRFARRKTVPFPSVEENWLEWASKEAGTPTAAVELSYNIMDVCERYQNDPDCKLFLKIMRGELCELAVSDQKDAIAALQVWCDKLRVASPNVRISRHSFFKAVRVVFPGKSRDNMDKLRFVLALWTTQEEFDFRDLFSEDGDRSQNRLIELIRRQHIEEIERFTVQVCEALRPMIHAENGTICVADAMNAVADLDPYVTEADLQFMFSIACRLTLPDLLNASRNTTVDGELLLYRLRMHVLLKRAGPAPEEELDDEMDDILNVQGKQPTNVRM